MRVLLLALAFALAATGAALAAERQRLDRETGVRFALDGRTLTTTIEPQQSSDAPDARDQLFGKRIRAACGTSLRTGRGVVVHSSRVWPEGALTQTFRFRRDVSSRVRWCLLETAGSGGDVAGVRFAARR